MAVTKIQKKLEKLGYKITFAVSGNSVFTKKNGRTISASSVTALSKKLSQR